MLSPFITGEGEARGFMDKSTIVHKSSPTLWFSSFTKEDSIFELQREKYYYSKYDPCRSDQSESGEEFSFDSLMAERLHTENRSYPSSKCSKNKKIFFWNPSFLCGCLVFIHSSSDEGKEVDEEEISDK